MVSVSRSQSRPQPAATRRCRGSRPGASCAGRARSRYRPDSETMAARAAPRHARTTTHGAILRQSEQPTKAPESPPEGVDRAAATKTTGTSLAIPRVKRSMPAGTSPDSGGSAAGEKPFQEVPTCLRRGFRKPQPRLPRLLLEYRGHVRAGLETLEIPGPPRRQQPNRRLVGRVVAATVDPEQRVLLEPGHAPQAAVGQTGRPAGSGGSV